MYGGDTLTDALNYALDREGGAIAPVAAINASGYEDKTVVKQSVHAGYNFLSTLNGVFNTLLIRATRQTDETLGLVAAALPYLSPTGRLFVAQENAHGADGLQKHLETAFGPSGVVIKYKCRVMVLAAARADPAVLARWAQNAAMRQHPETGYWTQPGLFSWNRVDAGSRLLAEHLPEALKGAGADLGCGYGYLACLLARKAGVTALYAVDADARAAEACRKNLAGTGVSIDTQVLWRDATAPIPEIPKLDWVVMNPPFHTQQEEDRELGQKFCEAAMKMLRSGGVLYVVANRHMPYEALLQKSARSVTLLADRDGFKILKAEAGTPPVRRKDRNERTRP